LDAQGGQVDVSCTNLGARFVVATTSATLQQLQAGLAPPPGSGPYVRLLSNPWGRWLAPNDIGQAVKQQVGGGVCSGEGWWA
jgi:hypothetical protein